MKRPSRKAKFRLEQMRVHEVGLVDLPANLEPFLVVKGASGATETPATKDGVTPPASPVAAADPAGAPPAPPTEAPPGELGPMPAAAKQLVIDAAGQIIEAIQGLAMAVGSAPTDDAAPVPPELVAGLSACGGTLIDLCTQLDPNYVEMARKPKEPPTAPAAPPGPPAPPPPDEMAKSVASIVETVGQLKSALESLQKDTKASVDSLTVAVKAVTIKKALREMPTGNGQQPENTAAPVAKASVAWPRDLAADVQNEENGAGNGR